MQTSDYDQILARIKNLYHPPEGVIGDTVNKQRAWVAQAVTTWNDLPCDEVIIQTAWDGVIHDMARRGKDPWKDEDIRKINKEDPELATNKVASIMADRVKHNMATKDLAGELRRKNEKQYLLAVKKLELFPGYATRAAWSMIQKIRAEKRKREE